MIGFLVVGWIALYLVLSSRVNPLLAKLAVVGYVLLPLVGFVGSAFVPVDNISRGNLLAFTLILAVPPISLVALLIGLATYERTWRPIRRDVGPDA